MARIYTKWSYYNAVFFLSLCVSSYGSTGQFEISPKSIEEFNRIKTNILTKYPYADFSKGREDGATSPNLEDEQSDLNFFNGKGDGATSQKPEDKYVDFADGSGESASSPNPEDEDPDFEIVDGRGYSGTSQKPEDEDPDADFSEGYREGTTSAKPEDEHPDVDFLDERAEQEASLNPEDEHLDLGSRIRMGEGATSRSLNPEDKHRDLGSHDGSEESVTSLNPEDTHSELDFPSENMKVGKTEFPNIEYIPVYEPKVALASGIGDGGKIQLPENVGTFPSVYDDEWRRTQFSSKDTSLLRIDLPCGTSPSPKRKNLISNVSSDGGRETDRQESALTLFTCGGIIALILISLCCCSRFKRNRAKWMNKIAPHVKNYSTALDVTRDVEAELLLP